jgi:hypothetical protein
VTQVDLGRVFSTVAPSEPPVMEGLFELRGEAAGCGTTPAEAVLNAAAHLEAEAADGVFRGLSEGASELSRLLRVAGTLTFSKEIRAAGRAVGTLEALPIESARLRLDRVPGLGLEIRELEVESPDLRLRVEGAARRVPEQPFVASRLDARVAMEARGDVGILFDAAGFLADGAADDYRRVTRGFTLRGTVGAPDAVDLYRAISEAGANAGGAYGWALRKAGSILTEE